ncbi:MAG: ATP-dependent Clp protease ATP-binding subunit [Bacteroides sp.]|nr:ATP-dependent Clp protease ATP-binding subunit [Prevotella sp.]MCM1407391.1 ATP-dependent Clp protease ATP-binding subunit [Treponema brennaborense]MCM1469881.1 ATP-dependent Clp protease ATP-binding subunit [Bacteroides sp.]
MKSLSLRAQQLLTVYAQDEGRRCNSEQLLPEHVMLGLLKMAEGFGYDILMYLNVNILTMQLFLEQNIPMRAAAPLAGDIPPSVRLRILLDTAAAESRAFRCDHIGTEHILLAAMSEEQSAMYKFCEQQQIPLDSARGALIELLQMGTSGAADIPYIMERGSQGQSNPSDGMSQQQAKRSSAQQKQPASVLREYSRDITEKALKGELDPVIGRDAEIRRLIQILSRRTKNNPVLVGEPGVGKTAIVEGLAQRIVAEDVPHNLLKKRILTLDLASVIAGTKYRGEFEERIKRIIKEINEDRSIILFIDELHTIIGAGGAEGAMDASNMLKPALSRGELQCIGATTLKEYRKYFEKDSALERRFQIVQVNEPDDDQTVLILEGIKKRYEDYHGVTYAPDVIKAAVRFSRRYITERFLPDKAIDILDEAGAMKKIESDKRPAELMELEKRIEELSGRKQQLVQTQNYELAADVRDEVRLLRERFKELTSSWQSAVESERNAVGFSDICTVVSSMTGIPVEQLDAAESQRLVHLEAELHKTIIGQNEAVRLLSSAVRRARAGVASSKRPLGSFVFLGPTGVGKTLLAKTLARFLFGTEDSLIRVDMSDFMEKHSASRLVGAPPGYVGYDEGGLLTEKVRRRPYSVILLDEIEKAHPDVFNLLLQILEEGELSDNLGHIVNFRNTVIIMTSNAGARQITNENKLGFSSESETLLNYDDMKQSALAELKKIMNPELINRIDDIVVFSALSHDEISQILSIQLGELSDRVAEQGISLRVKSAAREYFIAHGYEPAFGARPMRRLLQREIENPIAEKILRGACSAGCTVIVDCRAEKIIIRVSGKKQDASGQESSDEAERSASSAQIETMKLC